MRSSHSRQRQTYSQTQQNRASKTQTNKPTTTTLENTNLNVPASGRKDESKKHLPPKPLSKVSYNVECNMTESKICQAKQGLQLLKKKMNRTGSSREKSYSQAGKPDENNNEALIVKKLEGKQENRMGKEQIQKSVKPTSRNIQKPQKHEQKDNPTAYQKKQTSSLRQIKTSSNNQHDQKPISNNANFMALLEKQMQKQKQYQPMSKPSLPKNKVINQNGEVIILRECSMGCKRNFHPDALGKHQKICEKVFQSKRKAFDSSAFRQPQVEGFKPVSTLAKIQEKPKQKKGIPKWKLQSAQLRAGLKLGKNIPLSKQEQRMMQTQQQVLKSCQYCGRKFNEVAAQKHIPFCQKKSKQMPKNGMGKKR